MYKWVLAVIAIGLGSLAAYAQIINPSGGGGGTPGGSNTQLQFNTNSTFGGISGITSDSANVGFATSSNLILYSQTPGLCLTVDANFNVISQSCAAGTSTGIAAGSNITTSGTAVNVTVNVVATPSFTTVIASGNVTAGTAQFTGLLTGTNAVFQTITVSNLTPTGPNCLQETAGILQATNTGCATQVATPSIAAGTNITTSGTAANTTINVVATPSFTTVIAIGNLTAGGAQFTSQVTGTSAVFQTATISNLTPTGPNCLQETGGVLQATNTGCATQVATPSIAAGTNITTSGTAANTTVNVVATPSFTTVIATGNITGTTGQFSGFLTAGGASLSGLTIATETLSSNLTGTTANFSSNLTANIAQFAGFMSAGGASLSGLSIQTITLSGALNGSTAVFTGTLTGANASFTGDITATRGQFTTVTGQNFATQTAGLVPSPLSVGAGQAFLRADGTWATPATIALAASTVTAPLGWINYNGTTRTTVDVGFSTTTVPVNLMTINVNAGRTYKLEAQMPLRMQASSATIGFRVAGTATTTTTVYDGWVVDSGINGIKGNQQATALSTTVAGTVLTGTTGHATVIGTISVNAAGTLILQGLAFATGTAATTTTVSRGATFILQDMP